MKPPTVSAQEITAISHVLEMGGGYVLNFTNAEFSMVFGDFGIDIDRDYEGSKGKRMQAFLRAAEPGLAARVLEAMLRHRGSKKGDDTSPYLARVRQTIARLRGATIAMRPVIEQIDVLSLAYVQELADKADHRLASADEDGAITCARTMLEAVLLELERQFSAAPPDHGGDLQKLFKAVTKHLQMDSNRTDLDDNLLQVLRGLVQTVNGLAPVRNQMSDAHARKRKPTLHEARLAANAAKTVATFLVESHQHQQTRRPANPGGSLRSGG